jgi:protein TonB
VYPQFALSRNIEGFVLVEYTINVDGSVSQIILLESEPKNVFAAAVLKAIKNFKHSPNIINGEAVAVFGVRNRFEFKLKN